MRLRILLFIMMLTSSLVLACPQGTIDANSSCISCPAGMHVNGNACIVDNYVLPSEELPVELKIGGGLVIAGLVLMGLKKKRIGGKK